MFTINGKRKKGKLVLCNVGFSFLIYHYYEISYSWMKNIILSDFLILFVFDVLLQTNSAICIILSLFKL